VYRGLADFAARAASDEFYMTVFRLPLSDRINPHAFAFTIANMVHQRSDPRMKDLNFSLRSLMHESEGPFRKALNNARRALQVDFSSTLIVRSVYALFLEMMRARLRCRSLARILIHSAGTGRHAVKIHIAGAHVDNQQPSRYL
jgi:hypothetical protein